MEKTRIGITIFGPRYKCERALRSCYGGTHKGRLMLRTGVFDKDSKNRFLKENRYRNMNRLVKVKDRM
ncbi:MAG: hypothetical protein KAI16_03320 [Candidatus Pacebacteria bacterium]|nr:hypothetical protein [Candidatus Paceibacterota bacterium]